MENAGSPGRQGAVGRTGVYPADSGPGSVGRTAATARCALGKEGEALAKRYLQQRGLRIIRTNFRCRFGEIDIIAEDGREIVFVEVRSASLGSFLEPLESIGYIKMRRLRMLAHFWMNEQDKAYPYIRFDVIAVIFDKRRGGRPKLEHIKAAF